MEQLEQILNSKSEQELTKISTKYEDSTSVNVSNFIEPTEEMIEQVLVKLIAGESLRDIKRSVKKEGTNFTLSYSQIQEIETAWKSKLSEFVTESEEVFEGSVEE